MRRNIQPRTWRKIYWQRWQAELDLRSIKATMQMGELRCKTPAMVRKEIWAHFLAYNLIRGMIAQASVEHGKRPCQISFKGAVQTLIAFQYVLHVEYTRCPGNLSPYFKGDSHSPHRRPSRPCRTASQKTPQKKLRHTHKTSLSTPKAFNGNNLSPRKCH